MHFDFNPPAKDQKITARKTTITGLFFVALTPSIPPADEEVEEVLEILGMKTGECVCAYCGDKKTQWDHFRPIVVNRQPTGYITEIANLVPSCGPCNQSKGNKNWHLWMYSKTAKHSPINRQAIKTVDARAERLKSFENWRTPIKLNYEALLGPEAWAGHMKHLDGILNLMAQAESAAAFLRAQVLANMHSQKG